MYKLKIAPYLFIDLKSLIDIAKSVAVVPNALYNLTPIHLMKPAYEELLMELNRLTPNIQWIVLKIGYATCLGVSLTSHETLGIPHAPISMHT